MRRTQSFLTIKPTACRPEAYDYVLRQLPELDSTAGLVHCAVGISMHALDDLNPEQFDEELDRLANCVRRQCSSTNRALLVAHLHDVLFDQEGFIGAASENYYNPLNSYLSAVATSKRGIPITLALIYKAVGERIGVAVEGILSPGHFLVRVHDGNGWLIVDTHSAGQVLSVAEACTMVGGLIGQRLEADPRHLPIATHREWLTRILVNLVHVYETMQNQHDLHHAGIAAPRTTIRIAEYTFGMAISFGIAICSSRKLLSCSRDRLAVVDAISGEVRHVLHKLWF